MLHVLHITEALGGGVQSAIANYAMVTPHYRHAVFASSRAAQSTYAWPEGVAAFEYRGSTAGFLLSAHRVIENRKPDVVHLHSSYAGLLRATLSRKHQLAYSPHCYATERTSSTALMRRTYRLVERALSWNTDVLIAVSEREVRIAQELNRRTPTVVVPNFAPITTQRPLQSKDFRSISSAQIVTVGRICRQKDPSFFARVANKLPSARFTWIGDGDSVQADNLRRNGVEVTGWLSAAEVRRRVGEADLYLHTAAWEGAPLSTLEAISEGCPVLARSIESMETLGYPLAGEHPDEVAETVAKYFTNKPYANHVRKRCTQISKDFTASNAACRLKQAYESVATRSEPVSLGPK